MKMKESSQNQIALTVISNISDFSLNVRDDDSKHYCLTILV